MLDIGTVSLEWGTMLFQMMFFIPVLLFYAFVIYFLVSVLKFMKRKNQLDQERNQKLDRLIDWFENQANERQAHRAIEQIGKQDMDHP
ncbi:hypothetical protein [Brevibacillus sp. SYP-B805]|uniref:hypothetical protein n=1 Tax=Brevibacillus sp. SYP-B805 TaxID=1578199 RepID=UPI0019CFFCAF|nr:hypothetical protein [Brevibacillus sp. SYP-B805]